MHPDQYTPDAICRSMGLDGFIESSWHKSVTPVIRVLLKPSFSPEVCITLSKHETATHLSVVTPTEMVWHQLAPCPLVSYRELVPLGTMVFDEMATALEAAHNDSSLPRWVVVCDGMLVDCCLFSAGKATCFSESVSERPLPTEFVRRMIDLAWNACRRPRTKNALADLGICVRQTYPKLPVSSELPRFRILVLGNAEEREAYFNTLRARANHQALNSAAVRPH